MILILLNTLLLFAVLVLMIENDYINPANYDDKAIRAASQGEMSVSLCPFDH
jgi:hypothetical protein